MLKGKLSQRTVAAALGIALLGASVAAALAQLREVKTAAELALLRRAVRISAVGQQEVMKAARPSLSVALAGGGWAATTVSATMIAAALWRVRTDSGGLFA